MGDYASAEKYGRQAAVHQSRRPERNLDHFRELAANQIILAASLARLGRQAEAQQVLAPALKLHRELNAKPHDDALERVELARALYALALADSKQSAAALKEAAGAIEKLPDPVRQLKSVALLRTWITEEQRKSL
jgi:hypothetical protein